MKEQKRVANYDKQNRKSNSKPLVKLTPAQRKRIKKKSNKTSWKDHW